MLNILSYIGVNLQSELCLWTMLGLLRTIFDATLFKVNANLKQVWQMTMPPELSMPVQRGFRTMISGVMLVQCFTVYVYLASYIVLLYPVFLEERPTLVLPWLLLAAIRRFLCELTSLALGLGACVLLGPARPPCIKFVIFKVASITPAFYMWLLVFSYYNALKVATAFKRFPIVVTSSDHDYGLELAVRRRRTKSLQDEEQLRRKLVASFNYVEPSKEKSPLATLHYKSDVPFRMAHSTYAYFEDIKAEMEKPLLTPAPDRILSNVGTFEDWCGSELNIPRDTDRILEQFVIMLLRIDAYKKIEGTDPDKFIGASQELSSFDNNLASGTIQHDDTETPLLVGNTERKTASYLQEYPQIFMKKVPESESIRLQSEQRLSGSRSIRLSDSGTMAKNSRPEASKSPSVNHKIVKKMDLTSEACKSLSSTSYQLVISKENHEKQKNNVFNTPKELSTSKIGSASENLRENGIDENLKHTVSENILGRSIKSKAQKGNSVKNYENSDLDPPAVHDFLKHTSEQTSGVERSIKEVSTETYLSLNQTVSMKSDEKILTNRTSESIKVAESPDNLVLSPDTVAKILPSKSKSLNNDEIMREAETPTTSRALNITNPRETRSTMTDSAPNTEEKKKDSSNE